MPQTISEVIKELEKIVSLSITHAQRHGYFASLYLDMTRAVYQSNKKGVFENAKRMEDLCVRFAGRYLDALNHWQQKKPVTRSWQLAFDQTQLNRITVIQHILCGINAHINLDLAIAAAQTCPGNSIHGLKKDFDTINKVIAGLVDQTQNKLEKISLPMRWLDHIGKNTDEQIANFSIEVARKASWSAALTLAALSNTDQKPVIQKLDQATALLATKIISPGTLANLLLKPIHWFEPKNTKTILKILSNPV